MAWRMAWARAWQRAKGVGLGVGLGLGIPVAALVAFTLMRVYGGKREGARGAGGDVGVKKPVASGAPGPRAGGDDTAFTGANPMVPAAAALA